MMSNNKLKLFFIYVVIFCVTTILALVVLKNDWTVTFSAQLDNLQDDYFVIYEQNGVLSRFEVKVNNGYVRHNIPLDTSELYLMSVTNTVKIKGFFDHRYVQKEQIIATGTQTVNKDQVVKTFINDLEVDINLLPSILKAEKARLKVFFIIEAFVIGLCAIILTYIGLFAYQRKDDVNTKLAVLSSKFLLFTPVFFKIFNRKAFKILFLFLFAVLILFWRRPTQFTQPYIFFEDGTFILNSYLVNGFSSIWEPINGYYLLSSKVINILAYKLGFWYYPEFASLFANLFIIFVIFAIAYAPTRLKMPYFCAVMTLLIKTSSECFGVALYSFWWAGLLIMLALLWQTNKQLILRLAFVIVGGLSSAIVVIVSPLLVILAIYTKNKNDIITALVSCAIFLIQLINILIFQSAHPTGSLFTTEFILNPLRNTFGSYFFLQTHSYYLLTICGGIFLIIIFAYGLQRSPKNLKGFLDNNLYYILLLALLAGSVVSIAMRVPVALGFNTHPLQAEVPRYLFYQFILLAWISIWIITVLPSKYPQIVIKILMLVVLFNFLFGGAYKSMPVKLPYISWRTQLAECIEQGETIMPMAYCFNNLSEFYLLQRKDCIRLVEDSWFFNNVEKNIGSLKVSP